MIADGCQQIERTAEKYEPPAPDAPQASDEHHEDDLSDFAQHRPGYGTHNVGHQADNEMHLGLYPIFAHKYDSGCRIKGRPDEQKQQLPSINACENQRPTRKQPEI